MVRTLKYLTLLLLLPVLSSVATAQVGLSIYDTSGYSGSKLTIPIYVDTLLTGKGVTAFQIELSYYSYYMSFDTVITTGTLSQSLGSISYNGTTPGTLIIASAGSAPLMGNGVLIYVRFRLLAAGNNIPVSFSGGTANTFLNEGNPAVLLRPGSINILPAPSIYLNPPNALLAVGDQQLFTAYSGISPYHWSLTNPSVASIDSNGLLTATHTGFTKVVGEDSVGTIDTTGIIEIRAFRLTVRDTSVLQGQTLDLPIYTSSLTGLNIKAGSFQVQFDQNILTPTGVVQTGSLISSYATPAFNNISNGLLDLSFAGSSPLSGSGILMYLQFKVSTTNSWASTIYPANIVFNENIKGDSASGYFQTINLASLNINPSVGNLIDGDTLRFIATGGTPPYSWSTSDPTVASISSDGLLTALKGGSINVNAVDLYGAMGKTGTVEVYDTRISVNDTVGVIGDTLDIPLYISPVALGLHIVSLQATISFDSTLMHALGIVTNGTISGGWTITSNITGNQIVFAGAGSSPLSAGGILCKMRFVIPAYASSGSSNGIYFQQFMFNEGKPRAQTINGSITLSTVGLPATPTNLNAVAFNSGRIDLSWQDNADDETGYTLQRTSDTTSTWSTITSFPANSNAASDSELVDGTEYYYRVFATNGAGNSNYSNISGATTPMRPPTDLQANQIPGGEVQLTWQDNSASELGYYIERKTGSAGNYTVLDSVDANVSTYTDTTGTAGQTYYYRVRGHNLVVLSAYSNEVSLTITAVKSNRKSIPNHFDLAQNYPNPFNPVTVVDYQLPVTSNVTLIVYDVLGREVETLVDAYLPAGYYEAQFDAGALPSGIYFYRLTAGRFISVRKMVVMK